MLLEDLNSNAILLATYDSFETSEELSDSPDRMPGRVTSGKLSFDEELQKIEDEVLSNRALSNKKASKQVDFDVDFDVNRKVKRNASAVNISEAIGDWGHMELREHRSRS